MRRLSVVVIAFLLLASPGVAQLEWKWERPSPHGINLNDVTVVGGTYYAAGDAGQILVSSDARAWDIMQLDARVDVVRIRHANGRFVAGAAFGYLFTSTDGETWTTIETPWVGQFLVDVSDVIFADGQWVAVGSGGMLTSDDGVTWEEFDAGFTFGGGHTGIARGDGIWVVVGDSGRILRGTDLRTWEAMTSTDFNVRFQHVVYDQGVYLASGMNGLLRRSTDGETWETIDAGRSFNDFGEAVLVGDGTWYLPVDNGDILRSVDNGLTWEAVANPGFTELKAITPGPTGWVGVALGGETYVAPAVTGPWERIGEGQGRFAFSPVAFGEDKGLVLSTGEAGILDSEGEWTFQEEPEGVESVPRPYYVDGRWFITSYEANVIWSDDLEAWTPAAVTVPEGVRLTFLALRDPVPAFDRLWAVGTDRTDYGQLFVSDDDGLTWALYDGFAFPVVLLAMVFDGEALVATSRSGTVHWSLDGVTWADALVAENRRLGAIATDGAGTLLIPSGRRDPEESYYTSRNRSTWDVGGFAGDDVQVTRYDQVAYGGGLWYLGGASGRVAVSSDLTTWEQTFMPTGNDVTGLATRGTYVVATTFQGGILSAGLGAPPFNPSVPLLAVPNWERSWYGDLARLPDFPGFFFSAAHGWQYYTPASTRDAANIYDFAAEVWWWTRAETYPILYVYPPGPGWVWWNPERVAPDRRFLDLITEEVYTADQLAP